MRRVSVDDIKQMNIEYLDCHSYAEVARRTGWSASTVKNYIDPNFDIAREEIIHRFDFNKEMPELYAYLSMFRGVENYGDLCVLSDSEREEIKNLWQELTI